MASDSNDVSSTLSPTLVFGDYPDKNISSNERDISISSMRPLYTSCSEHYLSLQALQQHQPQPPMATALFPPSSKSAQSPFLRLPTEIRLHIYSFLVLPNRATDLLPSYEKIVRSTQDYFDYDKKQHGTDRPAIADLTHPTLLIRTIDPERYPSLYPPDNTKHLRASYSVRASRFRARCMYTTYHCVNAKALSGGNLNILLTNRQIHSEASEVLYGGYTFDFDTHVEAIIPFLTDLTPEARRWIKSVRLVKRALAYDKEFDRCEWANALKYVTSVGNDISLRRLELGVVAGRPGDSGWDEIVRYSAADMALVRRFEGMEWIEYLLAIKGLSELSIQAVVEHCPPTSNSSAMFDYVRFSASVESGFTDFMRQNLLTVAG